MLLLRKTETEGDSAMSKQSIVLGVCLLVVCLLLFGCRRGVKVPQRTDTPAPLVPAEEFTDTDVLPYLDSPITPGRNYIYCGTFQLAWNKFQDEIVKEPIKLEGDPPMAGFLNEQPFKQSDLSESSYLAMVGTVEDGIVEEIRRAMRKKFPNATMEVPDPQPGSLIYAYAYLQKMLAFQEAFDRFDKRLSFESGNGTTNVVSFGIWDHEDYSDRDDQLGKQVTILDYVSDDHFILKLNTASDKDELFLAKVQPGKTLQPTINAVQRRIDQPSIEGGDRELQHSESLIVPVIGIGVERQYKELIDRHVLNDGRQGYSVSEARQGIRFRLDEFGAKLESNARFEDKSFDRLRPRQLIFNKPFLIYLKEQSSRTPYFAMWIETPEVLERAP